MRLDADDAHVRLERLDRGAHARDESPAANWDDNGIEIGDVFDDLQPHRSLPSDDVGVVEAGYEDAPLVARGLKRPLLRVGIRVAVEDDVGAEGLAILYLHQ